ncbi:MAG: ABC transporter ATP-binding protein [Spirochaetes bacterium]|nr:ABC transporter ATP-binding protein [Spirochaetota bacterium]
MTGREAALRVRDLRVTFSMHQGDIRAVRGVSFDIAEGETMGLVGESGCGKSVTAFSVLRLIRPPGRIDSGSILCRGREIMAMEEDELRGVRGREIAMIFQEPMTSLNPVLTAGYQIRENIMLHTGAGRREARERAVEMLRLVGIPDPAKRFDSYPHEFSGGMRQRVMIAMSLSASPSILIADEPTTALDVTIQAQILDMLLSLQKERRMSLLLITHDLGIVANSADHVAIMYAGEIVEYGTTKDIFKRHLHPYTKGLFEAVPKIGGRGGRLRTIPGTVPSLSREPGGCVFYPRCHWASPECAAAPVELRKIGKDRLVRCIKA